MSSRASRIKHSIRSMTERSGWEIMEGTVSAIDTDALTVDVTLDEGPGEYGIKLRAVSNGNKSGLVCIPKMGSTIIFGRVRGERDFVMLQASELEKTTLEMDGATIVVSASGIEIKRGGQSLLQALVDFVQELQNVVVTQGTTPNVVALEAIKTRMKQILV